MHVFEMQEVDYKFLLVLRVLRTNLVAMTKSQAASNRERKGKISVQTKSIQRPTQVSFYNWVKEFS